MRRLVSNARCVLFDFDGPVCRLFAVRSAGSIAARLRDLADELAAPTLLTAALRASHDPHEVLRGVARRQPEPGVVHRLEQALTREEISAAATAQPTPHAAELITALARRGRTVAVATNNSPLAVEYYLDQHRLAGYVEGRVHGRTRNVALLKPNPDCVLRALDSTGAPPERAMMIGDTPSDLFAARAAGVPFVGYAYSDATADALREAGADHVVRSLERVLTALITPTFG